MSGLGERLRTWRPTPPPLPEDLAALVKPDDPEWFAREMAIAAAPPWWFWRFMLRRFSWLVSIFGRVEVTGAVPPELCKGPLLFAANHIGDFDPFVIAVALHKVGVVPRIMATGGIISAPVAGPLLERTGAIRVERGTELARHAVRVTEVALVNNGHVVAYPEGRVGLAPDGWPERGRTGMARMALGMGVPVIPVSQWGAHEVLQYGNDWGKLRTLLRAVVRRPRLQVHVGPPVKLDDLRMGRVGDANRARYRIAAAITRGLVPLRAAKKTARTSSIPPDRRPRWPPTRAASCRTTSRETRSGNDALPVLDRSGSG
ncbi:lysophospholipid acyltransferase family protein [Blastococcus sp. PRF04-17]|uniref:lysophospholipid acyltransferase family protein n=1 Tax=Blastococcus sp. PRF04-17 TaxID=2933797 RepID=UPI001FF29C86|nr:lysophospholipid acyltransferase family protein [Blastococcus sp. PRF04-17]UOY02536.1 1-acyl-sn-glycerol-3-phosphate acyltransferase [Blastococcus sp. PRF04-17]